MKKRKAYAPRVAKANNKPTLCMHPVCVMCLRTSAGKTKSVHSKEECPTQAKIEVAKAKLRAKRAEQKAAEAEATQDLTFVGEAQP